jgi:hypothetical protein
VGCFVGANPRFIDGYRSKTDVVDSPLRYVGSATIVDARAGWKFKNHSTLTFFAKESLGRTLSHPASRTLERQASGTRGSSAFPGRSGLRMLGRWVSA